MGTTMKLLATILAVAFSSPADFLINTRDTQCTNKGGQCLDWRYYVCTAGYSSGLCNGDNNRKCCNKCDNSCVSQENQVRDTNGQEICTHNKSVCGCSVLIPCETREAMESAMTWAVSVCTTPTTARIRGTLENVEETVLDNVAQRGDPAAEAENAIFKHTRQHM